jgi:hypothetical protein
LLESFVVSHAASLMIGLDIIERSPLSPMVHAVTKGDLLLVEILGKEKPIKVSLGRDVLGSIPFQQKIVEESSLSGKRVLHKQHGIRGYRVKRTLEIQYADNKKVETSTDYYPPTTDIFQVPVGFDPNLLPLLPTDTREETAQATPSAEGNDQPKPADVEIVDGKGAHAPTMTQVAPSRRSQ